MMKKALKWTLLSLLGLYLVFGFFILPYLITTQAPKIIQKQLNAELQIEDAFFDPLGFELRLKGVSLSSALGEPLLHLKEAIVNIELYGLFMGNIHLKEIGLIEPELFVIKNREGKFNVAELLNSKDSQAKEVKEEDTNSALPSMVMEYFHIKDATLIYSDLSKAEAFSVAFNQLGFRVFDIKTKDIQNSEDRIRFFTYVNDGGFIDIRSELLSLEPLVLEGSVDFESGKIFTGWSYLQEILNLEIADGKLNAHTDFFFNSDELNATGLDNIALRLERLRIKPKSEHHDILHVKRIDLNDGSLFPLQQKGHFDTLAIDDVTLHVKRHRDGSLNWEHYAKVSSERNIRAQKAPTEAAPWDVTLDHFKLQKFHVDVHDEGISPTQHFVLNDFNLSAQNLHSLGGHSLNYQMALGLNESMTCSSEGTLAHSYLDGKGNLTCKGVDLTWFHAYVDEATAKSFEKFDVKLSQGDLRFSLPYRIAQNEETISLMLDDASLGLHDIKVKQKSSAKNLMRFKAFSLDGITLDTSKERLHVKNIVLKKPRVYTKKLASGKMNIDGLIEPKAEEALKKEEKPSEENSASWQANIDHFKIERAGIFFDDVSLQKMAKMRIHEFNLHVKDISSDLKQSLRYESNMRINEKAKLYLSGKVRPEPLRVKSAINLQSLQLSDANPYIGETLNLDLARGHLDLIANLRYEPNTKRTDMTMKGRMSIRDFVVNESENEKTLIAFEKISASPFYFDLKPDRLSIEALEILGLYSNVHIDANKTLNFSKLAKEHKRSVVTADTNETNSSKQPAFPVNIVKLDFKNGITDFADDSLPLKFSTHIHDVEGTVYGISTQKDLTSYVNLGGVIDEYGSMKVDGSLNSGDPKAFTNLSVNFSNLALNNMSPYSASFAGRKIDEGKLYLDLKYKIVESQILGENSVVIKKIKLGESFEGESSLPLGLAIALLEDSDGVIDIDLPVEGNMDEPDFKYGALVMKTLGNLIIKVVSSPFSFLGSMLGIEGDELKFIAYESGKSILLPPEREKLDALSEALQKRPRLSLEVKASYNASMDKFQLQRDKFEALVIKRSGQKESTVLMDIDFIEDLYDEYYSDEIREKIEDTLEKEHEDKAIFKKVYKNRLLKELILKQEVSLSELNFLARARAVRIKNYLEVSQGIDAARIVLAESSVSEASEEGFINTTMEIIVKE